MTVRRGSCTLTQPVSLFDIDVLQGLKMEAVCFSETFVSTYKSTRLYISADQHRHLLRCHENLRCQKLCLIVH
jgi:hypothetical protein